MDIDGARVQEAPVTTWVNEDGGIKRRLHRRRPENEVRLQLRLPVSKKSSKVDRLSSTDATGCLTNFRV